MRKSLWSALGLGLLSAWAPPAGADQLVIFSPMPPIKTASGVYSGKDLILRDKEGETSSTLHIRLMDESFANSYGKPFIAELPPINIPFDSIWLNITITSKGHQFDRLATMWIDDIEIMRFSTPEPTDQGIVSYILKDLSNYAPMFKSLPEDSAPKRFIFDMGNIVDKIYDAAIDITVDACFYQSATEQDDSDNQSQGDGIQPVPAQKIIPISASRGSSEGKPSTWSFPGDKAETEFRIPRNTTRAVLTVAATGQGAEEFWWASVPESATEYHNSMSESAMLPRLSSFREVRVYIDDKEAGYAWPFPVLFTGGISPSLHRPVAGIQAFDLRENEIDLAPWLGLLRDGEEHTLRMEVWGVDDSGTKGPQFKHAGHHWLLSGKIFVWEAEEDDAVVTSPVLKAVKDIWGADKRTKRGQFEPQLKHTPINFKSTIKPLEKGSFQYTQSITRRITSVSPGLEGDARGNDMVKSIQEYQMQNTGIIRDYGQAQEVQSIYAGGSQSTYGDEKTLATRFKYELDTKASSKSTPDVPLSIEATMSHKLYMAVNNHSPLAERAKDTSKYWKDSAGTVVNTHKVGKSTLTQWPNGVTTGRGTTSQQYSVSAMKHPGKDYLGPESKEWYRRDLNYDDNKPMLDKQHFKGQEVTLGRADNGEFEPVERQTNLKPQKPGSTLHEASDYGPYPLTRNGLPYIYLRDRSAIQASTTINEEEYSADSSNLGSR